MSELLCMLALHDWRRVMVPIEPINLTPGGMTRCEWRKSECLRCGARHSDAPEACSPQAIAGNGNVQE